MALAPPLLNRSSAHDRDTGIMAYLDGGAGGRQGWAATPQTVTQNF